MWVLVSKDLDVKKVGGVICKESMGVGLIVNNILCEGWCRKARLLGGQVSLSEESMCEEGQVSSLGEVRWQVRVRSNKILC